MKLQPRPPAKAGVQDVWDARILKLPIESGRWIPAKAGMIGVRPPISDSPVDFPDENLRFRP